MTRLVSTAMAVALAVVSFQPVFAAPRKSPALTTQTAKVKMIKFRVRNDSAQPMTVRDGEVQLTIAPKQTADVKLPAGSQMLSVNGSALMAPGAVVAEVTTQLDGNTLAIR